MSDRHPFGDVLAKLRKHSEPLLLDHDRTDRRTSGVDSDELRNASPLDRLDDDDREQVEEFVGDVRRVLREQQQGGRR